MTGQRDDNALTDSTHQPSGASAAEAANLLLSPRCHGNAHKVPWAVATFRDPSPWQLTGPGGSSSSLPAVPPETGGDRLNASGVQGPFALPPPLQTLGA